MPLLFFSGNAAGAILVFFECFIYFTNILFASKTTGRFYEEYS